MTFKSGCISWDAFSYRQQENIPDDITRRVGRKTCQVSAGTLILPPVPLSSDTWWSVHLGPRKPPESQRESKGEGSGVSGVMASQLIVVMATVGGSRRCSGQSGGRGSAQILEISRRQSSENLLTGGGRLCRVGRGSIGRESHLFPGERSRGRWPHERMGVADVSSPWPS